MLKIKNRKTIYIFLMAAFICFGYIFGKTTMQAMAADTQYIDADKLDMLSVKCQVKERDDLVDLRMVSTIDQLDDYKTGGFEIYINPTTNDPDNMYGTAKYYDYERTYVCAEINAKVGGVAFDYTPKVFDVASNYFMTVTLTGIPEGYFNQGILIKPFVTYDGTNRVYGTSRYITINDGLNGNVLSVPVKNATLSQMNINSLTTSLTGTVNTFVDDEYTHVRITMDSAVSTLASITEISISDSNNTTPVEVSYRNLYSTAVTADTTWYNANNKKFVLVTAADLLGFAQVSKTDNFLEKTVYLGADITLNEGWTASATAPTTKWTPIGLNGTTINAFAGRFDGQGCTISGLYQSGTSGSKGMFIASKAGSTITDFSLVNSYFANTNVADSAGRVGGIVTYGAGTIDTIYCDAILKNNRKVSGGIVADANTTYGDLVIKNCQFAGTIMTDSTTGKDYTIGGIIGWARNNETTITDCLFTGTIDYGTNNTRIAGILARNGSGDVATQTTITNVLVDGTITGTSDTATNQYIGYVQGQQSVGTITVTAGTAYAEDNVYVNKNSEVTVSVTKTNVTTCSNAELTGANAESKAEGLFGTESVWTSQVMDHPVLKSFHWYNPDKTVYVINNAAELYEFAKISKTANFRHKIVYLGADITVNEGTSEEIKTNAATALQWTPIGVKTLPFAGTFDGQGYTISGIYCVDESSAKGLFLATAPSSVVKDFAFINSYIATTKELTSVKATAGIAAYGEGVFDSIYCDVMLENNAVVTGGIVADMQGLGENLEIKNCWFAGSIKSANTLKNDIDMGGIIGWARNCEKVTITDCLFTGTLDYGTGKTTNPVYTAGIVGRAGMSGNIIQIELRRVVSVGVINGRGGKAINAICDTNPERSSTTYEAVYENVTSETGATISKPNDVADLSSAKAEGLFSGDGANYWISIAGESVLKEFCHDFYTGRTIARNDYLETMNPIAKTPRTFEVWLKVDADTPNNVRPGILAGNYTSNTELGFSVEIKANGKPAIWWNDGNDALVSDVFAKDIRNGEWTHLAISLSADKAICYINGEKTGEIAGTFDDISKELLKKFRVGVDYRSSITDAFNSEYMEVASIGLYDDVRSEEEIKADMTGINKNDESLLGLYYIASDESDALKDLSDHKNHLASTSGVEETKAFTADKLYTMSNPLKVTPKKFDATVYFPETMSANTRGGVIFGNYVDENHACICFEIHKNGNPRIYLLAPNAESGVMEAYNYIFKDINVYNGQPTNISVTIEAEALKCFVDGDLKQTLTPDGNTIPFPPETLLCNNAMSLGGDARKNNAQYFKGRIASAALYDGSDNVIVRYDTTYLSDATTVIQDKTSNNYDALLNDWINPEEYDGVTDYAYSIAVLGDTQRINRFYPDKFDGIYDWIINNAASKNIKMVLGLGDITDTSTEEEWNRAQSNFQRLDEANIPYAVVRGNHDETEHFNQYFSYASYKNQLEGCMVEGDLTNAWRKVEINGVKYLIMMLDYGPTDAVLKWAGEVIEANKDHNVIITTHAYLFRDGTTLDENDVVPPSQSNKDSNNGDHMWDELIKKHENIVLVLSGHDPYDNVVTTQTVGDNGNVVTQMLIDPQNMDVNAGPAGMVAMLYFSEDGKTVQLEYYSTARNQYWKACNQYTITLDVVE